MAALQPVHSNSALASVAALPPLLLLLLLLLLLFVPAGAKDFVSWDDVAACVPQLLQQIQVGSKMLGVPLLPARTYAYVHAPPASCPRKHLCSRLQGTAWPGLDALPPTLVLLLLCMQADMLVAARQRYNTCLEQVTTWDEFMAALSNKHMVLAPWADEVAVSEALLCHSGS